MVTLKGFIDWEAFRPCLNVVYDKPRKSNAGAKPFDAVLLFKILVLQRLNNLSDDQIEYQIRDRLSFMRFLGLQIESRVPDEIFKISRITMIGTKEASQTMKRFQPPASEHAWIEIGVTSEECT